MRDVRGTAVILAALIAAVVWAGAGAGAGFPAPATPALAVVLEIGQGAPGGTAGVQSAVSGISVQDAILTAVAEALQAQGVAIYAKPTPSVPTIDVAGHLSITQRQVVLAQQQVVDVALYARLVNPDGFMWYAHGSGSATVTALANPYGYGAQVPAGTVRAAIAKAGAALVPQVVAHLEPVAPGALAPCVPAATNTAPGAPHENLP